MQDRVIHSKKIDWKSIQTLQPDNFKMPEQQEVLKKSLLANGFVSPFCVWQDPEGVIWSIDGVHRIKALTELQEQGQDIPQLLTANFIEAKDRKEAGIILLEVFNTKQNKATEQGLELLKIDLNISNDDLHVDFEDLDIKIDFEDPEITELETAEAPDEAPEPPTIPITAKGDLYELNGHRVLCGDSTVIDDIDKLMQGERADLVFTDPPYQIEVKGGFNSSIGKSLQKQGNDIEFISNFEPLDFLNNIPLIFEKQKINAYIFCNKELLPTYLNWAVENKYSFNVLIWKKPNAIPIRDSHRPDIEYLLLFRKNAIWNHGLQGINYSRALEYGREKGLHPTMKPIELITNELFISSNKNSLVADLFLGSGSTLIAAEQTKRRCYGIELEEKYCDVIVTRWVKMMESNNKEYVVKRNGEVINWEIKL
jgi:DNA modification methylase